MQNIHDANLLLTFDIYIAIQDGEGNDEEDEYVEEEKDHNDDDEPPEEDNNFPQQPRWRISYSTASSENPEWTSLVKFSPYQYFKWFLSDDIFDLIVNETMRPAKPLNLTVEELEQFFGTVLHISLFGLPATRTFWTIATLHMLLM